MPGSYRDDRRGSEGARAMIEALSRSLEGTPGRGPHQTTGSDQRRAGFQGAASAGSSLADLLPQSATLTPQDRMLLGRGVVAAADELLLAWLDNESNVSREDVVELVMVFFDAVADCVGD